MVLQHLRESLLPFFLCKAVNYSLQTNSSNWVHHNQLFQRHQRLQLLEEQCNRTFSNLKQLLSYVFVSGLHRNPFVMSRLLYLSLIELRGSNGTEKLEFGVEIFNQIGQPNLFSWNTMIRFFAVFDPVIALNYYKQMLSREMVPDRYTFPFVLQACGAGLDLGSVKQVHCHIVKLVLDHDLFVQNSLLNAYIICCSDADAWSVFNEMPEKDIVSWTSLISGLVSQCSYCDALYLFKTLLSDDCQPQPNVVTVVSTMSACASLGSMDLTKCFHALLDKAGWLEFDVSVVNSLIDAYAKCGDLCCARKVFEDIENSKRDLYSWTAIISGYTMHGRGRHALNMFTQMELLCRLVPDEVTFVAVLSACAHSGLVEEGLYIFELMSTKYGIQPDLRHYGCIVDILARAGMVYRAYNIVENMPMEPNLAVLGSLLSGCRLHNNLEFGEAVLRKIELLKDRGGGAPVLLSNMYADENQWSKVIHLRKEMRVLVQGKPPGRSWI
ncbi:UNVERIFIED_CONTAM: Pentatricopeptide repeat-containing protein, chloroplastic/mitochondrial [Sesamum indicum]